VWDPAENAWIRIYHRDYLTPNGLHRRTHGPHARFDHHRATGSGAAQEDPEGRSVIYLGENDKVALAEAFWDQRWDPASSSSGPLIARACTRHYIAQLRPRAPIEHILSLAEDGADAIGALPELSTGPTTSYELTREWAGAIYEDLGALGIQYPSAHQLGLSLVLFNTAPDLEIVIANGELRDRPVQSPELWDGLRATYAGRSRRRALIPIQPDECPLCRQRGLR
jgi:hypothetical protein